MKLKHPDIYQALLKKLQKDINPDQLDVLDETHKHSRHKQHDPSRFHLVIYASSSLFNGKSRIQQHRMIHNTIKPFEKYIHSVKISTHSPNK